MFTTFFYQNIVLISVFIREIYTSTISLFMSAVRYLPMFPKASTDEKKNISFESTLNGQEEKKVERKVLLYLQLFGLSHITDIKNVRYPFLAPFLFQIPSKYTRTILCVKSGPKLDNHHCHCFPQEFCFIFPRLITNLAIEISFFNALGSFLL